jgi:hypothetical protein
MLQITLSLASLNFIRFLISFFEFRSALGWRDTLPEQTVAHNHVNPGIAKIEQVRILVEEDTREIHTIEDQNGDVLIKWVTTANFHRFSQTITRLILQ